jgi:lysophospholipase L1-like esterase
MKSWVLPPLAAFLFFASLAIPQNVGAQEAPLYLALGDSLAFGVGADSPATQGYVALTAEALRSGKYAASGIDLKNVSVSGATSGDILREGDQVDQAVAEIEARGEAEIISIDIGANDLLALAGNNSPCLDEPSGKACQDALAQTLVTLQRNFSTALQRLREAAPDAEIYVLDLYNPYSGSGASQELIAAVGVQQINGVITATARNPEVDVKFVSIHDVFEGRARQWITSDGIHPNNDGYRVMAEGLTAAIEGRAAVLPTDLEPLASATRVPGALVAEGDGGVDEWVPAAGIPAAFVAGVVLSAAYFVVRGKRAV